MIKKLFAVFAVMMLCFGMTPMNINATEEEVYATKYETHEEVDLRAVYVTCPSCAAAAKKAQSTVVGFMMKKYLVLMVNQDMILNFIKM